MAAIFNHRSSVGLLQMMIDHGISTDSQHY